MVQPVEPEPPARFRVVAAPPIFSVVAFVLMRLNVPAVVVRSPPFTAISLDVVKRPLEVIAPIPVITPVVEMSQSDEFI